MHTIRHFYNESYCAASIHYSTNHWRTKCKIVQSNFNHCYTKNSSYKLLFNFLTKVTLFYLFLELYKYILEKMFLNSLVPFMILSPIFSHKLFLTVTEHQKPNSPIGNLVNLMNQTKTDKPWKPSSFQLDKSNYAYVNLISIDQKNGDVWIHSSIDREEICQPSSKCDNGAYLDYLIFADDYVLELQIMVIDINDNYPTFQPDEKILKIPEGIAKNTDYSLPVAKDKDSEQFGIKNYSLKSLSNDIYERYFKLVMNTVNRNPYLRVIDDLDRESIKFFEFQLFAVDGGGNQGKCKITIEITDINDNTPQWIGLPYRKEISECTTDSKVMQLVAQDKDDPQTEGGKIRFKISENSQNSEIILRTFFITEGILYLNNGALKSFGQNKASVVVVATDGGGRNNETTVEIEIRDCNDHFPLIQIHSSSLQIHENEKSKKSITMITVTDKDQGINSDFSCNLNDSSYVSLEPVYNQNRESGSRGQKKIFKLNTVPGMSFDREKTSRHIMELICVDSGTPSKSSVEKITIFIIDENDNPPVFDNHYVAFSISEDSKIGSEVGKVIATDIDSSPNNIISYSIIGTGVVKETFSITSFGQIQLSRAIDREEKDRYEFSVLATDNGKPTLNDSCKIEVMVWDVNDNAPEIVDKYYFKVVESYNQEDKLVSFGNLTATDRDKGINGTFNFKIKSVNKKFPTMQILNDGRFSVFGNIDREKSESIEVLIEVVDKGTPALSATTTVFIEVLDLNDNSPKFVYPTSHYNNFINISFNTPQGTVVGKVEAKDPDKGLNGQVVYTITGTEICKKVFAIHSDGQILLNEKLHEKNKPDRLTIEARDKGNPSLNTSINLYIRFPKSKNDLLETNNENNFDYKISQRNNPKKHDNNGISNSMFFLIFLALAVIVVLIVIFAIGSFLYYRNQGIHRNNGNGKHSSAHRDNSVAYQKGCAKGQISKTESLINNETLMRSENYNNVDFGIPSYHQSYTNLILKNTNCCSPTDNSYQFGHTLLTDNYSAFQPKSNSPTPDKDHQEFVSYKSDEPWTQQKQISTMQIRKKNPSECSDGFYETDHKYTFIHSPNINNSEMSTTHFTTSQRRRNDSIPSRIDTREKVKVNFVNSSFV